MGDLAALQYLSISTGGGCVELWNQARLDAYLRAGIAPGDMTVRASPCGGLETLLADDDGNLPYYVDPEEDEAPWWDPHPKAAGRARRFAGFLPIEVTGLDDDTSAVDVITTADGGSVFVNRRDLPREVNVKGLVVGADCCAAMYGLQWLKLALSDASCGGQGGEVTYLSCCPPTGDDAFCVGASGYCDPDVDDDCEEMDCDDEADYPEPGVDNDEWWRTLIGVAPVAPVKVSSKIGADCGCGGAPVLEVTFSLQTGNPHPWRPLLAAGPEVPFSGGAPRRPTFRFRKRPGRRVTRQVSRERRELLAVLRGNLWCPVGGWGFADSQAGGGEGYITIQEAVESAAKGFEAATPSTCEYPGDPKRPHEIRLIWDQTGMGEEYRFESIRWQNNFWDEADPLAAVPCDTPIEVVELVTIPPGSPPVPTKQSPGTGEDCCFVSLHWTGEASGTWTQPHGPNYYGDDSPWTEWRPADIVDGEGAAPMRSGWPPVGCTITILRNCPSQAEQAPADECPESVDCQITVNADGTWSPAPGSVTPPFDAETFPSVPCKYAVAGQTTAAVTESVTELVYGACPSGCGDDVDPLGDPANPVALPPAPPRVGRRCLPTSRVEARLAWSDYRSWDVVVPVVDFYSGRRDAKGVEIVIWPNVLGLNPADPANWEAFADCNACAMWSFARVPANARIRVDGRARTVTAHLPGGRVLPAGQLLESRDLRPLTWPRIDGCGVVAAVRVGYFDVDRDNAWAALHIAGSGA